MDKLLVSVGRYLSNVYEHVVNALAKRLRYLCCMVSYGGGAYKVVVALIFIYMGDADGLKSVVPEKSYDVVKRSQLLRVALLFSERCGKIGYVL